MAVLDCSRLWNWSKPAASRHDRSENSELTPSSPSPFLDTVVIVERAKGARNSQIDNLHAHCTSKGVTRSDPFANCPLYFIMHTTRTPAAIKEKVKVLNSFAYHMNYGHVIRCSLRKWFDDTCNEFERRMLHCRPSVAFSELTDMDLAGTESTLYIHFLLAFRKVLISSFSECFLRFRPKRACYIARQIIGDMI